MRIYLFGKRQDQKQKEMAKTVPNSLCSHRSEGISGLVLFSFLSSFLLLLLLSNMLYLFGASSFPWNPQKGTRMCRFASFFFLVLTNLLATLCSVFMSIFAGTLILNRFFYPFSYPSSLYIIKSSRYRRHRLQESRCMAGSHPPSTVCVCVCVCVCVWGGGGGGGGGGGIVRPSRGHHQAIIYYI